MRAAAAHRAPRRGTTYHWAGTPHASESVKRVNGVEVARNLVTNPVPTSMDNWTHPNAESEFVEDGWLRIVSTALNAATYLGTTTPYYTSIPLNDLGAGNLSAELRNPSETDAVFARLALWQYGPDGRLDDYRLDGNYVELGPGEQVRIVTPFISGGDVGARFMLYIEDEPGAFTPGNVFDVRHIYLGDGTEYFDGDTPPVWET